MKYKKLKVLFDYFEQRRKLAFGLLRLNMNHKNQNRAPLVSRTVYFLGSSTHFLLFFACFVHIYIYIKQRKKLVFDHSELILSKNRLLGGLKLILVFQMQLVKGNKRFQKFSPYDDVQTVPRRNPVSLYFALGSILNLIQIPSSISTIKNDYPREYFPGFVKVDRGSAINRTIRSRKVETLGNLEFSMDFICLQVARFIRSYIYL